MSDDPSSRKRKADTAPLSGESGTAESFSFSREQFMEIQQLLKDMKEGRYVTKEEFDAQTVRIDVLTGRMNLLVSDLEPAIMYARFETAVYQFVKPIVSVRMRSYEDEDSICYAVATICGKVLEELRVTNHTNTPFTNFSWQGPSTDARQDQQPYPTDQIFPVLEAGLKGIEAFVERHSELVIRNMSSEQRNQLVHNGESLKSILGSPQDDMSGIEYEEKKASWKGYQTTLDRAISADVTDAATSVNSLVQKLGTKNIDVLPARKNHVITSLNRIAGISTSAAATGPSGNNGVAMAATL